ncbi:MAG: TIGR02221 family CRISPR-associated protein [Alkalinema sp. RU_4_3]|nr:TIGR02221 family CRISPR-associated protein [Alkalinema sp. RU_4_3]
MQKIITFLGLGSGLTKYQHSGQVYEGSVFPQVLRQFQPFDEMLVCLTAGAREKTWHLLENLKDDRIIPIDIPDGRTEAEIWTTFQAVIQHIDRDDRVIFDITHGLRSLPFQVFLFAAYLRAAKNAEIEAVYYGAYDLKDADNVAPVIDLSSFVGMLDWLTATDRFTATGDGKDLAQLIRGEMASEIEMNEVPDEKRMGEHLKKAANAIDNISLALALTRPEEVTKAAKKLKNILTETTRSLNVKVKPFSLVKEQVQLAYGQFAITDYKDAKAILMKQFAMIRWYLDRQQIGQVITLSREWIISVYCWKFKTTDRTEITQALNNLRVSDIDDIREKEWSDYDEEIRSELNASAIKRIWKETTKIRNQVAHCGMSGNDQADDLRERTIALYPDLEKEIAVLLH